MALRGQLTTDTKSIARDLSLQKVLKFLGFGKDICSFIIVCESCHDRAEKHCIEFGDLASGLDWDSLSDPAK